MKALAELIDRDDPAMPLVREWLAASERPFELLAPGTNRGDVLVGLQVSTRSPMGAIAHETGGILVDHGWLRILGSGHPKLPRNIVDWNAGRSSGFLLVADDIIGGFFAIDGGSLGGAPGVMHYWAPDTLEWEALGVGYTDFIRWSLSERLSTFYKDQRWPGWETDTRELGGDQCFNFYPFLWSAQGSAASSSRKAIGVAEQYAFNLEAAGRF